MEMTAGGDIDKKVIDGVEQCDTFLIFGSSKYGEDTGNPASTYFESKFAQSLKKRTILIRMIPFEEQFEFPQARFLFGLNMLELLWEIGTPMPPELVDGIVSAVQHKTTDLA